MARMEDISNFYDIIREQEKWNQDQRTIMRSFMLNNDDLTVYSNEGEFDKIHMTVTIFISFMVALVAFMLTYWLIYLVAVNCTCLNFMEQKDTCHNRLDLPPSYKSVVRKEKRDLPSYKSAMKAYTSDHILPQYANPYHLQETMELIVEGSDCNANTSSAVPSAIIKPIANSSNPASESMVSKIDGGNAGSRVQTVLLPSQAKQAAKSTKSLRQKMKRKQSEKRFFQFPSQSADSSAIRQQSDSCQNSHKAAVSTARQLPLQQDSSCLRRQTTSASSLRELQAQPSRSCQTAVSSTTAATSSARQTQHRVLNLPCDNETVRPRSPLVYLV